MSIVQKKGTQEVKSNGAAVLAAAQASTKEKESQSGKSGIKTFKPGDIIFHENDPAESLYIIQRGQIRLFLPKGRGYVEIAILRAGEVIGEMAYFDEKARRRSCSAAAIITTEVVEISFKAFSKTMSNLNPWFKTIINTLADRLRKTNAKVKELENNSVGFGKNGKVGDYTFFHNIDVVRMLAGIYLCLRAHGQVVAGGMEIHLNTLKFYLIEIFNIQEVKYEEFFHLLTTERFIEMKNDKDNLPKILRIDNVEMLRDQMIFFNTQRILAEDKKLKISSRCERFLKRILEQLDGKQMQVQMKEEEGKDNKVAREDQMVIANISEILTDFKNRNVAITDEDLKDAIEAKLVGDIIVGEKNTLTAEVSYLKLKKLFPSIRLVNIITKANEEKSKHQ